MKERGDRSQADDTCSQVCGHRRTALSTLPPSVSTMGRYRPRGLGVVLVIIMLGGLVSTPLRAQDAPAPATPAVVTPGPGISQHESVLSPVPEQFDWIRRDVRPNTLLESLITAQAGPPRLLFSISLSEEYSDNFDGDEDDPREEFLTTLSLGTAYRLETARAFVSLANSISGNYEAREDNYNVGFANLTLNAGYDASWWSLGVSDSFIRDDDFLSSDSSEVRRGRRKYFRNTVTPQVRFAFGPLTSLSLAYTNIIVINDDDPDDSITHAATVGLSHQFSRRVSSDLSYNFTLSDDDGGADTRSHQASGSLNYNVSARTVLSLGSSGSIIERRNGGTDATTYGGDVGLTHRFSNDWQVFTSLGATVLDQAGEGQQAIFTGQGSLNGVLFGREPRTTTLTITAQQGVEDTAGDVDSVGIVQTTSASVSIGHAFSRAIRTVLSGDVGRSEQFEDTGTIESEDGRVDLEWGAGISATYAFARTWLLSLEYRHSERFSDASDGDFDENRASLTVSTSFSAL